MVRVPILSGAFNRLRTGWCMCAMGVVRSNHSSYSVRPDQVEFCPIIIIIVIKSADGLWGTLGVQHATARCHASPYVATRHRTSPHVTARHRTTQSGPGITPGTVFAPITSMVDLGHVHVHSTPLSLSYSAISPLSQFVRRPVPLGIAHQVMVDQTQHTL
jgi:hypothetical protein